MKAYKAAKTDPAGSDMLVDAALKLATGVPLSVAEKAHEVVQIAQSLFAISNPNMKSDLTTAKALASAAITGALANVEINLAALKDQVFADEVRKKVHIIAVL
jgi:formiminotetrahydrofolate cyclodeaminase